MNYTITIHLSPDVAQAIGDYYDFDGSDPDEMQRHLEDVIAADVGGVLYGDALDEEIDALIEEARQEWALAYS